VRTWLVWTKEGWVPSYVAVTIYLSMFTNILLVLPISLTMIWVFITTLGSSRWV